jgi:N-acetylglucosamine kinase-like BadF-type ATPase
MAIDGGGSKTTCVVAGENSILGTATSGGSNITRLGEAGVREALLTAVRGACTAAKVHPAQIQSACAGLSGAGRAEVREAVERMLRGVLGGRLTVVSDLETTLQAAFGDGPGVITIAGTGSIAYGRDASGRTARAGGWGLAISDEGSGQWIGRATVSAVLQAHDAGENPSLLAKIFSQWDLNSLDELVRHANASPPPDFSSLFPLVLEAAENPRPSLAGAGRPQTGSVNEPASAKDPLAIEVLQRAGRELAAIACNVMRRLFASADSVPVAMSGGVFRESERVRQVFYNGVRAEFPRAQVNPVPVDPLAGALALARKTAGGSSPR